MTTISVFAFIILLFALVISRVQHPKNPLHGTPTKLYTIPMGISVVVWVFAVTTLLSLAGKQYLVVSPTGTKTAISTEGIKFIVPFSKVTVWDKFIDVRVASEDMTKDAIAELEGTMSPVGIRFVDQVTAKTYPAVRFQLPIDAESFIAMAIKYRSVTNLANNTLIPTIKEQLLNTGYMFSAQDYISGEAQNFRQTFEEQLKYGAYKVQKLTVRDTIYNGDISQPNTKREIASIKTSYNVVKVLENGVPVRIPTEITDNNIVVSQVILDNVTLEKAFVTRLENQRDESAKRQLEQQKVKTAKDARERIIAEGERDKAQEKVRQELAQVQVLIKKETMLKEEETNRKLALIQLETEKIKSDQIKVAADAQAYEISKKVRAGITPETELKMRLNADIKKVEALAGWKLPTTMFIGGTGGKGNDGLLTQLIGAKLANEMLTTTTTK